MVLKIYTRTGSQYRLAYSAADGYSVTRLAEAPIQGYDGLMVGEPVLEHEKPTVGAAWRYRTEAGWFWTTTVKDVVRDFYC